MYLTARLCHHDALSSVPGKAHIDHMTTISCAAVLFDLDGVLVDSREVVERTWRRWAGARGLNLDAILSIAHGRRTTETPRTVAPQLDVAGEAATLSQWELGDTEGLRIMPGATAILRQLAATPYAVVTSGSQALAELRLTHVGLEVPSVLVTAESVSCGKPDPEGYLIAANHLGVRRADCLVIEDAPAGIEAGRAAGMRVLAVATTHEVNVLRAADWIVDDLASVHANGRVNEPCAVTISEHAV